MIYPTLTEAQRKRSQKLFIAYNLLNGLGYLCVGDMVMLFIINQLGFPDVVFTVLAAMFNIGCIWLPLGKIATEYWGAARTQGNFWFLRNIAAVIMGSCAIWGVLGHPYIAIGFLLGGAFLFYGCRAAGGVMSTALIGNITREDERGKLLAFASMAHNIINAVFTLVLTVLLYYVKSIWALYGIVLFGACCGILSAVCLWCIDESEEIRQAAKKPLIADAWVCLKNDAFRRMVIAEVCFSMAMAVTTSLNMLILTRGFGISKSLALIIGFGNGLLNVALARPAAWIGEKFSPRKGLIIGYCFTFLIIFFWLVAPGRFHWASVAVLFFLTSMCSMCCGICNGLYFLKCVPPEHQPSALTLKSLINGVLTGFLAMGITTLMWKFCDWIFGGSKAAEVTRRVMSVCFNNDGGDMERYRIFFLLALPLVVLGFIGVWAQKEV